MQQFVMTPKTEKTEDADGLLTKKGMSVAHEYALAWVARNVRDLELERTHPELRGLFYDIRSDVSYASQHAVVDNDTTINRPVNRPVSVIPLP